jgi:hypothetical protein
MLFGTGLRQIWKTLRNRSLSTTQTHLTGRKHWRATGRGLSFWRLTNDSCKKCIYNSRQMSPCSHATRTPLNGLSWNIIMYNFLKSVSTVHLWSRARGTLRTLCHDLLTFGDAPPENSLHVFQIFHWHFTNISQTFHNYFKIFPNISQTFHSYYFTHLNTKDNKVQY